jgi:hypothetical protein
MDPKPGLVELKRTAPDTTFRNVQIQGNGNGETNTNVSYFMFERWISDLEKETPYLTKKPGKEHETIGISSTFDVKSYQLYFALLRVYTYCPSMCFECFNQLSFLDPSKFQKMLEMMGQNSIDNDTMSHADRISFNGIRWHGGYQGHDYMMSIGGYVYKYYVDAVPVPVPVPGGGWFTSAKPGAEFDNTKNLIKSAKTAIATATDAENILVSSIQYDSAADIDNVDKQLMHDAYNELKTFVNKNKNMGAISIALYSVFDTFTDSINIKRNDVNSSDYNSKFVNVRNALNGHVKTMVKTMDMSKQWLKIAKSMTSDAKKGTPIIKAKVQQIIANVEHLKTSVKKAINITETALKGMIAYHKLLASTDNTKQVGVTTSTDNTKQVGVIASPGNITQVGVTTSPGNSSSSSSPATTLPVFVQTPVAITDIPPEYKMMYLFEMIGILLSQDAQDRKICISEITKHVEFKSHPSIPHEIFVTITDVQKQATIDDLTCLSISYLVLQHIKNMSSLYEK